MEHHRYYVEKVLPRLKSPTIRKYKNISLSDIENYHSLKDHQVIMLVALTGTGKTTTLNTLVSREGKAITKHIDIIPSRREIADWIAIPTAQTLLDEPVETVRDRVKRFFYTQTFADQVEGGMATAFSWVNIVNDYEDMILSEGIRGENEIVYALSHFPNWHIIELALDPISRLKRLSSRQSEFDKVQNQADVSFLPMPIQDDVRVLVEIGEITKDALTIIYAESKNYGLYPFVGGESHTHYHQIDVSDKNPDEVARDVYQIMMEIEDAPN